MNDPDKPPRTVSLPSLIGWLSLCMLAAAWGRTIDPSWQGLWANAGAAGLVAAVILERAEKARLRRKARTRKEAARVVSENRLAQLNEHHMTRNSVIDAIHQLSTYAGPNLSQYPLKVMPVEDSDAAFEINSARSIDGALNTISPITVSFAHDEAFDEQIVLLKFILHKRKTLCFVVEMIGTQSLGAGFTSTGTVLAAGVPDCQNAEVDLAETLQNA